MTTHNPPLPFTKMHSLGNDFVVIDCTQQPQRLSKQTIRRMADRHRGIGFDQLLLINPSSQPGKADFDYRIFNANGDESAQCGNGARCLARYVYERGMTPKSRITLATLTHILEMHIEENGQVRANMGIPQLEPDAIPFVDTTETTKKATQIRYPLPIEGHHIFVTVVGLGNPHAVLVVEDSEKAPVETWGPLLQQRPCFPQQANIGFMQIIDSRHIKLRVYERGAGETLACGSGACAAVVAGRLQDRLDATVTVSLHGGELHIAWEGRGSPIYMTGPAAFVFDGNYPRN